MLFLLLYILAGITLCSVYFLEFRKDVIIDGASWSWKEVVRILLLIPFWPILIVLAPVFRSMVKGKK